MLSLNDDCLVVVFKFVVQDLQLQDERINSRQRFYLAHINQRCRYAMLSSARLCKLDRQSQLRRSSYTLNPYYKFLSVWAYCLFPQLFLSRSPFAGVKNTIKNVFISNSIKLVASDLLPLFSCANLKSLSILDCRQCSAIDLLKILDKDPSIIKCRLEELRFELGYYSSYEYGERDDVSDKEEDQYQESEDDDDKGSDRRDWKVVVNDNSSSMVWGLSLLSLKYIFAAINPAFKLLSKRCACFRMMGPIEVCKDCKTMFCEICAAEKGFSCQRNDCFVWQYQEFTCFECSPDLLCSFCCELLSFQHRKGRCGEFVYDHLFLSRCRQCKVCQLAAFCQKCYQNLNYCVICMTGCTVCCERASVNDVCRRCHSPTCQSCFEEKKDIVQSFGDCTCMESTSPRSALDWPFF